MLYKHSGYFTSKENLEILEQMIKRGMPGSNLFDRMDALHNMLLFPPPALRQSTPGIIRILALDIASKGAAFPDWKRKHYTD